MGPSETIEEQSDIMCPNCGKYTVRVIVDSYYEKGEYKREELKNPCSECGYYDR